LIRAETRRKARQSGRGGEPDDAEDAGKFERE
jgi:hypothetical protein